MRNNFTFCSGIKAKKLDQMEKVINLLQSEKIENDDLTICLMFKNLLDKFDKDIKEIRSYEVIDEFGKFYEDFLREYCKREGLGFKEFDYFDFEQTQYVFDTIEQIINLICGKYGL